MAGSITRRAVALALAGSLLAAGAASAQSPLGIDPYMKGRCPGANGYEPGFHVNFNPQVNAWPVYEPSQCGPRHPGEPEPEPEPNSAPRRGSEPAQAPAARRSTPVRRRLARARCAKRHARSRWRCVRRAGA